MKHFAKALSLLLAVVMLLSMLPLQALALENAGLDEQVTAQQTEDPAAEESAAEEPAAEEPAVEEPAAEEPAAEEPAEEPAAEEPVAEESAAEEPAAEAAPEAVDVAQIVDNARENPLYQNLLAEEPAIVTDSSNQRSSKSYSDYNIVHERLRGDMISRNATSTIYCYLANDPSFDDEELATYLNLAWEALLLKAVDNNGASHIGGDYLAIHVESVGGAIELDSSTDKRLYLTLHYTFTYYTTAEEEQQVQQMVAKICHEYTNSHPQATSYHKIKFVYEYITRNVKYDTEGANDPSDRKKLTAYGALIENSAVDSGYAALFYIMIRSMHIECRIIMGDGENPRIWNIVQIDYEYYNVDAVLDAKRVQNEQGYGYFLKCNATFAKDHALLEDYEGMYTMAQEDYDDSIISKGSRSDVEWVLQKDGTLVFTGTGKVADSFESTNVKNDWNNYGSLIQRVVLGEGITELGRNVFRNSSTIKSVTLPSTLVSVAESAFENCTALTEIEIPANVTKIERYAFRGCTALKTVTFLPRSSDATLTIGDRAFAGCTALEQIIIPHNTDMAGDVFEKCTALTYAEMGKGTTLWDAVFYGCSALKTVVLPEDLVTLNSQMFRECVSLENIELPQSLEEIQNSAFWNCDSLQQITIPSSVNSFYDDVFTGADNLHIIIFEGGAPERMGHAIFEYVTATVYYPAYETTWTAKSRESCGGNITWKAYKDRASIGKFDIAFANMTLGNSLAMNFAFPQDGTDNWEGAYALIAKTYADGRGTKVASVPISQWGQTSINGKAYYTLKFNGIAAKEMADEIYITIYNGQREPISNNWEDSVRSYAMRTLNNPSTAPESLTMIVDLLNYGAAAQLSFGYDTGNLANKKLTAQQAALATPSAWAEDHRVKGENYLGTQLRLESQIMLRMAFSGVTKDMTAVITYTDHYDRPQRVTIPGSDLELTGSTAVVTIDEIVVADARQDVTVQILDSDGNMVASATDSVASYIARMRQEAEDPLYESILKFADSAYLYFHPGAQLPQPPAPPAPEHSEFYVEGLSQDQVVKYFNEVCFGSEYGTNTPYIRKWAQPISYAIYGDPTAKDLQVFEDFVAQLNAIEGFPGMYEATSGSARWEFHFCESDEMAGVVGDWASGGYFEGAVTIWYNGNCEITDGATAIRVDLDQHTRSSVILEEIYNGLGPLMDTVEREDSIVYQYGSDVTELSDSDWVILKLLYSEEVKTGMDKETCEEVLRSLYW